jgi:peptide/nickel transport system substrate-binding protein
VAKVLIVFSLDLKFSNWPTRWPKRDFGVLRNNVAASVVLNIPCGPTVVLASMLLYPFGIHRRRTTMLRPAAALTLALLAVPASAQPTQTLRIAVTEDGDMLDPTLARTYVSRIMFGGLCDKLFDINEKLEIVPQLALSYEYTTPTTLVLHLRPGVLFHDGTQFDAEAVVYTLKRHLTLPGSTRRAEISAMDHAEVVDPLTVRIVLKFPSAPFLSQLTDRAGMIISPKAAEAAGANFSLAPVCTGPFRFTERVAQDRVVLDRFPQYWNAQNIHFARVIYRPMPDSGVKFANLRSGTIDLVERLSPTDVPAARADKRLSVQVYDGLGYGSISFNVANGPRANSSFGQNALVRKAFELSIDRQTLSNVVFNGMFTPVAQAMTPANPFYNAALRPLPRDLARARALLQQSGVPLPVPITLTVANSPDQLQVGEVMQAMAGEAGFDVKVQASEFGTSTAAQLRGDFDARVSGFSGRTDPDGNLVNEIASSGPLNGGHYKNKDVDSWMEQARLTADIATRRALYAKITNQVAQDMPMMYLYTTAMIMGMSSKISGFRPVPDGLIRLQGLRMAP